MTDPAAERHEVGKDEGDACGRFDLPDEDAPRGYKPKPCAGTMMIEAGFIVCDTCGVLP